MNTLLLRPEEAAAALGVGRTTVYELMRVGALESVSIGRSRRIPVEALSDFVERRREETESNLTGDVRW
jgi:excisionase family DNA binding protein